MSLKSRHMRTTGTYLWPRLLSADFHPGTHFSFGHLIDTETRLPSLSLTPVPAASLSFLYSVDGKYTLLSRFLISLHQEGTFVPLASNYNWNLTTSHCAYYCTTTIVWNLEVPKLPLFGGSVLVLVLGSSRVVRAVPGVTSHHFSAHDSGKAKVLT